jgi:hypothetical protein
MTMRSERVKAMSVAAYWTVRGLGMAGTEAGKECGLGKSTFLATFMAAELGGSTFALHVWS